jgi:hypothetical protein
MQQQQSPTAPASTITPAETAHLSALLESVIEKTERSRGTINMTPTGVEFGDFEGVQRYAKLLVECGCVPTIKDDTYQGQLARATMCILLGRRVGLSPEQAVTSIYVVNCRPVIFGDAPLAICRQHPLWAESGFREYWEVGGKQQDTEPDPAAFKDDATAAVCVTMRKGAAGPKLARFSMAHAKASGLLGRNAALYGGYPQRMLRFRARGYTLRDNFGDALKGIGIRELEDAPKEEVAAEPPAPGRISFRNGRTATPAATSQAPEEPMTPDTSVTLAEPPSQSETAPTEQQITEQAGPEEPDAAEAALAIGDFVEETIEAIGRAQSGADLAICGASMNERRAAIGEEAYGQCLAAYQARHRELTPKPVASGAPKKRSF